MKIKARTTIDMDFSEEEKNILVHACALFDWIEEDLREYKNDEKIDIIFNDTNYTYSDFRKMSILLDDIVAENS